MQQSRLVGTCRVYKHVMAVALTASSFHRCFTLQTSSFPLLRILPLRRGTSLGMEKILGLESCRSMSVLSNNTPVHVKDRITLTDLENNIFNLLLDVVKHFNLGTELRVAGGWVRDKLLGKDCYDIDIALDNMKGEKFCENVNEYLAHAGKKRQSVGVIQCNPDQSKHLETATMRIFDMPIDFVNLRSEAYAENSRIPTVNFGTAEEDAYRRDLTINSLFYNINTNSVEDLTGRGISDLKAGIIVTPLPPKATFLDDPLRVLRAIRFGARFGFILQKDLKEAATDEEVKAAFAAKISRERVGHEIDLMISGNQPVKAMTYICELQLFWVIFGLPLNPEPAVDERSISGFCVAYMDAAWDVLQEVGSSTFNDKQHRLYLYGALFLPLRKFTYIDGKAKRNSDAQIPIVNNIFKNSLKRKSSDAEMVINLHNAMERFISLISFLESGEISKELELEGEYMDLSIYSKKRIFAGKLLQQIKDFWRVALLLSTLLYPNPDEAENFMKGRFESNQRGELFRRIEKYIIDLDLENVWLVKPLIDGKAIMNVLGLETGGPLVKEWQQRLSTWQLADPSRTAEECRDWIRQSHAKRTKLEC